MELNQFRDVDVVLDKANDNVIQKQFVSVGDKDGRSLTVQITENGAVGEVIGLTLNLRWHNEASGLTDLSAFSVVDRTTSVFKIDYPQNMLTPGKVIAYIQILHGGKVTHTKPFEITVQKLAGTTRGVLATAEYGALVTTLAKANEFETDIAEVTAQLAQTMTQEEFDSWVATILDGGPSIFFDTLAALQTAYPNGSAGVALVRETDPAKIYVWNGTVWQDFGPYQGIELKDGTVTDKKVSSDSNIVLRTVGKNKIDINKLISGGYVNYLSGAVIANANNSYLDFIELIPERTYTISIQKTSPNVVEQFALYSDSVREAYTRGFVGGTQSVTFTTTATERFARFTVSNSRKDGLQLEIGSNMTAYEDYQVAIPTNYLSHEIQAVLASNMPKKIISVKKDGTGDYTNLRKALESLPIATMENQFEIQVHEGEYDVFADYTQAEVEATNFVGLKIPKYVHLRGIGHRGKVHLKGDLPDNYSESAKTRVATLATLDTGDLVNLKVTARNLRYAVHDDYNYPNYERNVIDCDFIKYAGGGYVQAYGEGCWSGTRTIFENCTFHTESNGMSYSCHNNIGFTKPSYHKIKNCKFTNKAGLTAIRFGSMGSGQKDIIELENNKISGQIKIFEEVANSGAGIDFFVQGYGNDDVPIEVINSKASQQVVYDMLGITKELYNGHTEIIPKGTLLKYNSFGNEIVPMAASDTAVRFIGVAMQDIPVAGLGFVRIGGYLPVNETNLTGLSLGQKIGIVNGALAVVTTGDYIGIYEINNYIRLKNNQS